MHKTNWTAWYLTVLLALAAQIILYYLFTQHWA